MRKGGAAPVLPQTEGLSENDYQVLYNLDFDEGDLEMVIDFSPSITLDDIIYKYVTTAQAVYNIDIPIAEGEVFIENVENSLRNSRVTKRDIALETIYNLTRVGLGGKKTKRRKRTGKNKKSKKSRTKKSRR